MYAIFDANYDGGEFCQGLLFSIEATKVYFALASFSDGLLGRGLSASRKNSVRVERASAHVYEKDQRSTPEGN